MDLQDKIRHAAHQAWKVHEMAMAVDVVHDALPASYPEGIDHMTRQAYSALPVLIEQLISMTAQVAEQVERLDAAQKVEAANQ